jgi:hypothetical protein
VSPVLCPDCPRFHAAGTPCPPGWHDVQSEGGGGISARTWRRWALSALVFYALLMLIIGALWGLL